MTYAQRIADVMVGSVSDSAAQSDVMDLWTLCRDIATPMGVTFSIDGSASLVDGTMAMKATLMKQFDRISAVCSIAASRGYVLPDNPIPRLKQLNSARRYGDPLGISKAEDDLLEQSVYNLSKVAIAYDAGKISFERHSPAAQIASFEVSVDGISSQSGDPLSDILGYQPDGDSVKRKRALDNLAKLDFSKRKPYLLFTANVVRDGKRQDGTIICWQRMRDASGYKISKRDVFSMIDIPPVVYSNASLEQSTAELKASPEFLQIVSFYDWLRPNDYFAVVDDQIRANALYSYSITALQTRSPASPSIFDVPMSALYLSTAQVDQIRQGISQELSTFGHGDDADSISPYPSISRVVYGDPGFGWILAGCNVLAAVRRGDSPDDVRKLSFVGSKSSDILGLLTSGKVVVPNDISTVHGSVETAISSFGISQAILSILDGVGLTIFISGKDNPNSFQHGNNDDSSSGGLAKILSAIDPISATVDPHVLASSLITNTGTEDKPGYSTRPVTDRSSSSVSQPLDSLVGSEVIDLTTYVGVARLMQLIRAVYDFFPGALT